MKLRTQIRYYITVVLFVGILGWAYFWGGIYPPLQFGLALLTLGIFALLSFRAYKELIRSREQLAAVFDKADQPIFVLDEHEQITVMNDAAKKMFQPDWNALLGVPMVDLLQVDGVKPRSVQVIADSIHTECFVVLNNAKTIPMEVAISAHGCTPAMAYTVYIRDISARKFYEELLIDAKDDAEALGNAKTEFLATMSHEIRTPMNGVLGMTQLLLDMELNVEQREAAKIVYSSAESLLTVINDILDYAKIESGKMDLEKIPFDLNASICEVVELLNNQARTKGIELLVDYDPEIPVGFVGDVGRIRQIVLNLLGNALKFTEAGHVVVKVKGVSKSANEVTVKIDIVDTGIGIPKAAQASLFESFTQADASTTRKFGGTGLGLAISRQLVELMGGEIGVDSIVGNGSTFWFTFNAELVTTDVELMSCINLNQFINKRALLLDDHEVGLEIITRSFSSLGFETTGVRSAARCLEALAKEPFDIVVLDYMMPEMDGEELLQKILSIPNLGSLITLMVTSAGLVGKKETLLAMGLDGYLLKPIIRQDLIVELSRQFNPQQSIVVESAANSKVFKQYQLRVLLAEDNIVNQKVASKMLEQAGCRVDIAANGTEAITLWQDFNYQLIFMDCQMPELDGLSATRKIRSLETRDGLERIPIIALTANALQRDQEACLEAGMDDYVAKPVRQDLLLDAVERWSGSL